MARYVRHKVVSIEEAFERFNSFFAGDNSSSKFKGSKFPVRLGGLRLRTFFKKGCTCKDCGLKATHFAVEKCKGSQQEIYHLNLWALADGKEILFTHDHQIARCLGGSDTLKNSVPMCERCNSRKSKKEGSILQQLRDGRINAEQAMELAQKLIAKPFNV